MMLRSLARTWLVALGTASLSAPALGYDSKCHKGNAECPAGIETARSRWNAADSEHYHLWNDSVARAGLPAHISADVQLAVPSNNAASVVGVAGVSYSSISPVPFSQANSLADRSYSIGEMAQLPDFSYSLWDWALGNETCPLGAFAPEICHDFKAHMGAVNSSHFIPQTQGFYKYYHRLALARAGECATMRSALGNQYPQFVQACDQEAFTFESIAHHHLQDAWSMGHMWERWGGPDLSDFGADARPRALLLGAASGMIHGSRGLLQSLPPPSISGNLDFVDPLCAPLDPVAEQGCASFGCSNAPAYWSSLHPPSYVDGRNGTRTEAVGDLYLGDLRGTRYTAQYTRLLECAQSSIIEVADAGSVSHTGGSVIRPGTPAFDQACFAQRATNSSVHIGSGIDVIITTPIRRQHLHVPFTPLRASGTVPEFILNTWGQVFGADAEDRLRAGAGLGNVVEQVISSQVNVPIPGPMQVQFRNDLADFAAYSQAEAIAKPGDTGLSGPRLKPLIGVGKNGTASFLRDPPASYVDPVPPYSVDVNAATSSSGDAARGNALARTYHRSHASEWCKSMAPADLEKLRTTGAGPKCDICVEFASRHLRVGSGPASYDATQEPLCNFLGGSNFIYQPAPATGNVPTIADAAKAWCGCTAAPAGGCTGTFSGSVVDAATRQPISFAQAAFASEGASGSVPSAADGSFVSAPLACGAFAVTISAEGYVPATVSFGINEAEGNVQLVELAAIDDACTAAPGDIAGRIIDGTTDLPLAGASVELHAGVDAPEGSLANTATSDAEGNYTFSGVAGGYYTLLASAQGYEPAASRNTSACAGPPQAEPDIFLVPVTTAESPLSFVLTWARPADLDLHLLLPGGEEVSFGDCAGSITETPFSRLDIDHQNADGPEAITVGSFLAGTYTLFVHNFSAQNMEAGAQGFLGSEAEISVYRDSQVIDRFVVPSSGDGFFWDVLRFDGSVQPLVIEPIASLNNNHVNPLSGYLDTCRPQ